MSVILALVTAIALIDGAAAAAPTDRCDVPESFLTSENDLTNVTNEVKTRQRLDISVIGTGSSALAGLDGVRYAYPARLEQALQQQLKGITVKVTTHVQPRVSTADMVPGLAKILGIAAWLLMALAFQPILRFYRVSPLWGLALPAIAATYMAFTLDSAYQHARGRGGMWKGRAQADVSELR